LEPMTKADQLSHLCLMIRGNCDHCERSNLDDNFGYIERLRKLAMTGVYATEGTSEIMDLEKAGASLTKVVEEIGLLKRYLLKNSESYPKIVNL